MTNKKKKNYKVEVKEELSRVVEVEATTGQEAEDIVADMYYGLEIILGAGDHKSTEFKAVRGQK